MRLTFYKQSSNIVIWYTSITKCQSDSDPRFSDYSVMSAIQNFNILKSDISKCYCSSHKIPVQDLECSSKFNIHPKFKWKLIKKFTVCTQTNKPGRVKTLWVNYGLIGDSSKWHLVDLFCMKFDCTFSLSVSIYMTIAWRVLNYLNWSKEQVYIFGYLIKRCRRPETSSWVHTLYM